MSLTKNRSAQKARSEQDQVATDREIYEQAEARYLAAEGLNGSARFVDLKRLESTLRVVEAGEGPPVLFVPGVMTSGVVFARLAAQMPDYRCIMIDRPGVGLSPMVPNPPTSRADHDRLGDHLLVDILDGLDIDRSDVICTSMGGWATFRSIAAHPDRFDRLVALAFQIGAGVEKMPLSMRMPRIPFLIPQRVKATPGLVRGMLKSAGMKKAVKSGYFTDEMLEFQAILLRHTDTFGNESLYSPEPDILHPDEVLSRVDIPVHFFWGTDDLFGGEKKAREFSAKLPNATLQMVEGAGHAPWFDEPEMGLEAIRKHLAH